MSQWFRFYTSVVDDPKAQMLAPELFKHWVNVLCIAAQNDGELPPLAATAFTLRLPETKAASILAKLCSLNLLDKTEKSFKPHNWDGRQYKHDKTDNTNAERQKRYRNAKRNGVTGGVTHDDSNGVTTVCAKRPDTETDTDTEAKASGAGAPPDPAIPEREYFMRGREVLGKGAGGLIGKLLKAKGGNVALARAAIEQASQKQNPTEYVAACCRDGPIAKPLTEFQRKQQETNDVRAELRKLANGVRSGGALDRVLPADTRERPEGLRGGSGSTLFALPGASGR